MRIPVVRWFLRAAAVFTGMCLASGLATAASTPHYLVTNDDVSGNFVENSVTFYTIAANGQLALTQQVFIGFTGIGGGYFAANRVVALNSSGNQCIYASDAATGIIAGVDVNTLTLSSSTQGSAGDTGAANGIGLALNSQYLYASFTDSNTIGTFQIQPSCGLTFVGDISVAGLQGGVVDGMALRGNMLVVTYGDGSIESFNTTSGAPVSNGDEQNSTASRSGSNYPTGIDITQDGRFAIFGDTSSSVVVEVSAISSGKLTKTVVYQSPVSINSSNIMLSPDESLLYISNTQGDAISAAIFNAKSGKLLKGCKSGLLRGYSVDWSYLGSLAFETETGTGQGVYVAEFGAPSSIGVVKANYSNGKCSLAEVSSSPIADANSQGLLSIISFPPRAF